MPEKKAAVQNRTVHQQEHEELPGHIPQLPEGKWGLKR